VPKKQPKKGRLWLTDGSCIRLRPENKDHVEKGIQSVPATQFSGIQTAGSRGHQARCSNIAVVTMSGGRSMAQAVNPYGDGRASQRIARILNEYFS